jgi:hypothetical protein
MRKTSIDILNKQCWLSDMIKIKKIKSERIAMIKIWNYKLELIYLFTLGVIKLVFFFLQYSFS